MGWDIGIGACPLLLYYGTGQVREQGCVIVIYKEKGGWCPPRSKTFDVVVELALSSRQGLSSGHTALQVVQAEAGVVAGQVALIGRGLDRLACHHLGEVTTGAQPTPKHRKQHQINPYLVHGCAFGSYA